ncbi:MAG: aminotransferase class V-fold PLP-dependent enzyme, partial [Pseudomonadota bacterium]
DPEAWAERIDGDLALIAAPLVTSVTGQMLPAAQIAALPRPEHTLTLLDAAQGLGRVPMDQAGAWDIVAATSRKWLRAPRQTALMRLSPRAAAALGAEAGGLTGVLPNIPLRLGLADALAAFRADPPFASIEAQDTALRTALAPTGWVQPKGAAGTVTLAVPEDRRPGIAAALAAAGMEAKWCTPTMDEPRAPWPEGHAALRLSPLPDTSPDTLEAVIPPLQAALAR